MLSLRGNRSASRHRPFSRLAPLGVVLGLGAFPGAAGAFVAPPASAPVNTSPPTIQAPPGQPSTEVTSPEEGRILTSTAGTWTASPTPGYYFQWAHCDTTPVTLIPGATNRTYTTANVDVLHTLCVVVTARNRAGSSMAVSAQSGVVEPGSPIDRSAPTVSGVAQAGDTLTVSPGTWGGTSPISFAYQWRLCDTAGLHCFAIHGATSAAHVVAPADIGHTVRVKVIATNEAGSTSTNSAPTAVVSASPTTISPAAIRGLLAKALVPRGWGTRIGSVLKHGGYSFFFAAPSPGRLSVSWYRLDHRRRIPAAVATVTFRDAGTERIRLVLTGRGRRLLEGATKLNLIAQGAFTPNGHGTTIATKSIALTGSRSRRHGKK